MPALGVIALRPAVAADVENAERHFAQGAAGVLKGERKVAIDTVPDLAAFRLNTNGLDHGKLAVLGDPHGRLEAMDDFRGGCCTSARERDGKTEKQSGDH